MKELLRILSSAPLWAGVAVAPAVASGTPGGLPALGSAAADQLAPIDTGAVLEPGPDGRTLDLSRLGEQFPPHSPVHDPAVAAAVRAAVALKVPHWSASVKSFGKTYAFTMIGQTVLGKSAGTTTIKMVVIPLRFEFTNGTLDATKPLPGCSPASAVKLIAASPLLQKVKLTLGKVDVGDSQYEDLFQRGNFWSYIGKANPNYHLLFKPTQGPVFTIKVNGPASAATCATGASGGLGTLDFATWDSLVQKTIIPKLAKYINPGVLPVFLSYDVVFGGAAGYHNAYSTKAGTQTYAVSTFLDLSGAPPDSEVLSHELGEWVDDPTVVNPTPAWGHTGQVKTCQSNLEVGDPLTGLSFASVKMPNGYTYTVQDLTFFSWFYRGSPSIGVNGQYTLFNYFHSVQGICH